MRILISLVLLIGCGHVAPDATTTTEPISANNPVIVEQPRPQPVANADVAVTGVNLAEHCPELQPQAAAEVADMGTMGQARFAPNQNGGFGMWDCYLTLSVTGTPGERVDIRSVRLLDNHGGVLANLAVSEPRLWDGSQFNTWDGTIPSGQTLQVNYRLHGIDWNAIPDSYARTYKVKLTVDVGNASAELISAETGRQAMVVT